MIVVVGNPIPKETPAGVVAGGLAASIALAAASAGRTTQLIARVRDDPDGDAMLLSLAAGGVGHVATLRQPMSAGPLILQPADLELGLRYLADLTVLVLADAGEPGLRRIAVEAASWNEAALIAIVAAGEGSTADLPDDATVLEGPGTDADGAFASLVGRYAAALDRGDDAKVAFQATLETAGGWSSVEG